MSPHATIIRNLTAIPRNSEMQIYCSRD